MKSKLPHRLSIRLGFYLYPNLTGNILLAFPNIKRTTQGFRINSCNMSERAWRWQRRKKRTMTTRYYGSCHCGETLSEKSGVKYRRQGLSVKIHRLYFN